VGVDVAVCGFEHDQFVVGVELNLDRPALGRGVFEVGA
jgi:hypothetical protein